MKPPTRGLGRPLHCLILLATAGAVLAADNSWMTRLRFDFTDAVGWLSNFYPTEARPEPVPLPVESATRSVSLSMDRLANGRLYSQSTGGWQLDGARFFAPILMAAKASGPIVEVNGAPSSSALVRASSLASSLTPNSPSAVDGIWASNAAGNWGTAGNWQSNAIADGAGATAHFDLTNISNDVTVNLDTSRTIRNLYIGDTDTTNHYTISPVAGTTLTFNRGANFGPNPILQQTSTSAGDTIAADIIVPTSNNLDINNLSPTHQFVLTGNISSLNIGGAPATLFFNNHDTTSSAAGDIRVSGNISDGNTGVRLSVVVVNGGTVTLTGTNTYTGITEVEAGTLLINGNNTAADGGTFVDNTGTLGGVGTVGGHTNVFGGTVTGDTTTTVGTLSFAGGLTFGGEGPGGTYLANLSGSLSDLLAVTTTLSLFSGTGLTIVGSADNIHTYILATFSTLNGTFDPTLITGIPAGYSLVYNANDIELVPTAIPEPSTWIGGALGLGALGWAKRRRRSR